LQDAAAGGNVEVVRLLLKRGAAVDARNGLTGATALMMAVEMGKGEAVKALLQAGADRGLKDDAGRGVLDRAAGNGEMVKLLSAQSPLAK
jgi:ankyrin repeat protein